MPAGVYPGYWGVGDIGALGTGLLVLGYCCTSYWGTGVLDFGALGTGTADAGVYPGDLEPSTP